MTQRIAPTDDLAACHALRRAVFIDEQQIPEPEEWDDLDAAAVHLLATRDGRPVGSARLLVEGETGRIGRVCVLREARGSGLGAALVEAGLAQLRAVPGVRRVELSAQCHALDFYGRLGFRPFGAVYDDAGIPHRAMARDL